MGARSIGSCGCRLRDGAAPTPQDVRGDRGGTGTRGIDGAERAVAEEGAVEVGRWWRRRFTYFMVEWESGGSGFVTNSYDESYREISYIEPRFFTSGM